MVDMTFCGNCICIDYILHVCNISIIDWKKICWWCSHILWRPWPRFKNKKSFRKDEYMFLFDGMPEMAGSYNGYPLVSQHYRTFFSASLPVNDLCFLILSWSLEHASIFLTWAQNQSNLLAKKILPLWKENHLFTAYMYYCWYAVLVGW